MKTRTFRSIEYSIKYLEDNKNHALIILKNLSSEKEIHLTHNTPISLKVAEYYARKAIKAVSTKNAEFKF